jgi:UDP-N-acetylglucosamine 4,6-dehydratase
VIGTRHGEKLFEALLGREEMACAEDLGDYFRVPPDARDLNYAKFVEQGEQRMTQSTTVKTTTRTTPPAWMWTA